MGLVLGVVTLGLGMAAYAAEYNFYEQADKKGCSSIITERGQSDCAAVQRRKDDVCSVPVECDVDKQERLIAKYTEAKDRLERGQVADADKDKLEDTVRTLKEQLDANKDAARKGSSVAEPASVRARMSRSGSPKPASRSPSARVMRRSAYARSSSTSSPTLSESRPTPRPSATPIPATRARRATTSDPAHARPA